VRSVNKRDARTTTSVAWVGVIRLSSQYSHLPPDAINAVSAGIRQNIVNREHFKLTMSVAETAKVIGDTIQVIFVRWYLDSGIVRRCSIDGGQHAWWEWRGHVVRKVQTFERKVHKGFNLVRKWPLDRETLEVNKQNWGKAG